MAGWHRDPSGRHELRFWDGDRWTEHVVDAGIPGLDVPTRSGRTTRVLSTPTPVPPPFPGSIEIDLTTDRTPGPPAEGVTTTVDQSEADAAVTDADGDTTAESDPDLRVDPASEPAPEPVRALTPEPAPEPEPVRALTPEPEPAPEPEPVRALTPEPEPTRHPEPARARVEPPAISRPSVASPTGNSAGSNTSAIADPHRRDTGVPANTRRTPNPTSDGEATPGPRIAGVTPVPVKRYRPGSPPPSPFVGTRALPAAARPLGTVIEPWYRKPSGLIAAAVVAIAGVALIVVLTKGGAGVTRLGGRPPAAAPEGSTIIDGDGFGIAAPAGWTVANDAGVVFPQFDRASWRRPLVATNTTNGEALVVVVLQNLRHQPQVDPDLFWSDQVRDAGTTRTVTSGPPLGVHGFRANRVTVTDPSGKALVAASIDTGDRVFLVAFTARSEPAATTQFERLIQTFDAR